MSKKLLYAMRHCETLFNAQHKSQGWCDSPITPRGVEQCRIAGEELARRGVSFDHFFTSTSERCCDTMELVCQTLYGEVKPYVRMKGLRECGFGIFEAKDDYCEPGFAPKMQLVRGLVMEAGGGENDDQINTRIEGAFSQIMSDPAVSNALVVGSGGSLRHFYMLHGGANSKVPFVNSNCMTYVYEWEDGEFTCIETYAQDFSGWTWEAWAVRAYQIAGYSRPRLWRCCAPGNKCKTRTTGVSWFGTTSKDAGLRRRHGLSRRAD